LAGRRQDIVLCSKAGHGFWASLPVQRWVGPLNRQSARNFRPSALETAVSGSLRRLRTDRLDVLYLHNPPPRVVQDDDVIACVERMKSKGYIRFWGISCAKLATADDVHQAVVRKGVAVVQIPASCVDTLYTAALARDAAARGVALVGASHSGTATYSLRRCRPRGPPRQGALRRARH
jgi:aryl-alcohol dehydrogenase-like predicted oxidoreductase